MSQKWKIRTIAVKLNEVIVEYMINKHMNTSIEIREMIRSEVTHTVW